MGLLFLLSSKAFAKINVKRQEDQKLAFLSLKSFKNNGHLGDQRLGIVQNKSTEDDEKSLGKLFSE